MRLAILLMLLFLGCTAFQREPRSTTNRLSVETERILENADTLELFSLEPNFIEKDPSGFHGSKILGRVGFEGRRDRRNIVAAIQRGIAESDGSSALCFIPRHGIRATQGNKSVDLVICFQCLQIQAHRENQTESVLTSRHAQELLNELLTAASIPLPQE